MQHNTELEDAVRELVRVQAMLEGPAVCGLAVGSVFAWVIAGWPGVWAGITVWACTSGAIETVAKRRVKSAERRAQEALR